MPGHGFVQAEEFGEYDGLAGDVGDGGFDGVAVPADGGGDDAEEAKDEFACVAEE